MASLADDLKVLLEAFRSAHADDEHALRKLHADHVGLIRNQQKQALQQADAAGKKAIGQLTNQIVRDAEAI